MGVTGRRYSHWEVGTAVQSAEHRFQSSGFEAVSGRLLPRVSSDDPVDPETNTIKAEITFTIPFDFVPPRQQAPEEDYDRLPAAVLLALEYGKVSGQLFCAEGGFSNHFEVIASRVVKALPEGSRIVAATVKIHMNDDFLEEDEIEMPKRDPKWV